MAASHGKDTKILVNGYNVSGYYNSATVDSSRDEAEVTGFGASAKSFVAGQKDTTVSLEGHFDGDADAIDQQINTAYEADTNAPFTVCLQGDTQGNRAHFGKAKHISYSVDSPHDGAVGISTEMHASDAYDIGYVLHALGAETATGNGTGVDRGAGNTSSTGFAAEIQVTAVSGTGTPTITGKLQDSTDNVTFGDVTGGGFTARTAIGAEHITHASTSLKRYVRAAWTISGTTPSLTFQMVFAAR
jgi:predicted secreted protein